MQQRGTGEGGRRETSQSQTQQAPVGRGAGSPELSERLKKQRGGSTAWLLVAGGAWRQTGRSLAAQATEARETKRPK